MTQCLYQDTGVLYGSDARMDLMLSLIERIRRSICRDVRVSFGDYVQCQVPYTDNSMSLRTSSCIALYPTGSRSGSCKFLVLKTMKIVVRDKWTALPTPQSIIDFVNGIAANGGRVAVRDPVFAVGAKHVSVPDLKELVSSSEGRDHPLKGRTDALTHPGPIIENFDTASLPLLEDTSGIDTTPSPPSGLESVQTFNSHSGGCLTLGKGSISWKSKKQTLTTTSTAETELVALSEMASLVFHAEKFLSLKDAPSLRKSSFKTT
jgi:hypothetical protein